MCDLDAVTVHVEADALGERDDGEGGGRGFRRRALEELVELVAAHAATHVLVRHDDGAAIGHVLVAARVVAVPVSVDHEPYRLRCDGRDRGLDPVSERRVLVIDDEGVVLANGEPDVSARTLEHVDARHHRDNGDLDLREILLGAQRGYDGEREDEKW